MSHDSTFPARPVGLTPNRMLSDDTLVADAPQIGTGGLGFDKGSVFEDVLSILEELGGKLRCITAVSAKSYRYEMPAGRLSQREATGVTTTTTAANSASGGADGVATKPSPTRRCSSGRSFSPDKFAFTAQHWRSYVQPDGKEVFIHEDHDEGVIFSTESNLKRLDILIGIEEQRKIFWRIIQALRRVNECPAKLEIYLNIDEKDGTCLYYMIDHPNKLIFWAHDGIPDHEWEDDISDAALEHLRHIEFWTHLELFSHTVPADAEPNARAMICYSDFDSMTASGTTSQYSHEECVEFYRILDQISSVPGASADITRYHIIARLSTTYARNRYFTYYGEEGARLDRTQKPLSSRLNSPWPGVNTVLFFLGLTVFRMDIRRVEKIEQVLVDNVVLASIWKSYLDDFVRGIDQSNIVAAIMLAANISFLSIAAVTNLESTASLVSTLFSLTSLLMGLLHIRQHNSLLETHAYSAAAYFQKLEYPSLGGYRILALFHCLPLAFLLWAIITFCLAIGLLAYRTLAYPTWVFFITAATSQALLLLVIMLFFSRKWEPKDGFRLFDYIFRFNTKVENVKEQVLERICKPPEEASSGGVDYLPRNRKTSEVEKEDVPEKIETSTAEDRLRWYGHLFRINKKPRQAKEEVTDEIPVPHASRSGWFETVSCLKQRFNRVKDRMKAGRTGAPATVIPSSISDQSMV